MLATLTELRFLNFCRGFRTPLDPDACRMVRKHAAIATGGIEQAILRPARNAHRTSVAATGARV